MERQKARMYFEALTPPGYHGLSTLERLKPVVAHDRFCISDSEASQQWRNRGKSAPPELLEAIFLPGALESPYMAALNVGALNLVARGGDERPRAGFQDRRRARVRA